ncbi:PepSY domain-containing protein [Qipengyuania zhejiangensis]|uniref:PepSY domain-containing protein n=1 Tax=Qipengyuania zhejiangensis TaxID=3077782 RepID=UPI002D777AAA|nr:PepSY domain-containing protein [Qipengyuania sp. Z2]
MKPILASILALGLVVGPILAEPAAAQRRTEQGEARREMNAGNIMPLRDIESRILPTMKGAEYLGPAYDPTAMAYRLKFIRDGRVLFVDVDARTGRVLRRSR